jgi:hypothetical protein
MTGSINVAKTVEYLRYMGIDVTDEQAEAWAETERETRAKRRRHRAELKRTCGHFRTYWCTIVSNEGTVYVRTCSDCRRHVERRDSPQ